MPGLLLENVRVLDLTMAYAGPIGTRILADMGAQVIKVESIQRMDMPTRVISYPENEPGEDPWNRGGYFHRLNVNKYCITLDLTNPEGVEIFKRLVKVSDVVAENYSPRTMKNFGLDYEVLKAIKPDIIMVSMSGFGSTGPLRDYAAYVPVMEAAGLASVTGFPDGGPMGCGTGYGDWALGMAAAASVLVALHYRYRTGKGQHIDVSGREAIITSIGEAIVDYTMNGRVWGRMGNRHPSMAPHGCYRCKGEDQFITIAVATEEQWEGLCKALGNPAWTREERFSDVLSRWHNQDELDSLIEEWTSQHDHYEAMRILQQARVPAGAVLNPKEVLVEPHLRERGCWQLVEQGSGIGKRPPPRQMPAKFSESWGGPLRGAARLGEHTEQILGGLLGMSKEEIARLEEEQVFGRAPLFRLPWRGLRLSAMAEAGVMKLDPNYLEELSSAYGEPVGPTAGGAEAPSDSLDSSQ
jgi:crotonobetainyl-CoA:carnitine CoA-transferase CaiB-like acyl-CoA transferase